MKSNYPNICIITLDSLRYDVAVEADMQNVLKYTDSGKWYKCGAQGTNTLPAHVALFQGGQVPYSVEKGNPYSFYGYRFFRPELDWDRDRDAVYKVPESANIVRGFSQLGFITIGLGGVGWFSTEHQTSSFWGTYYFDFFEWNHGFSEKTADSFENQIAYLKELKLRNFERRIFLFVNVSTTHIPFFHGTGGWLGQIKAARHVDYLFARLIEVVPLPCHFLIMADHGTCFAEKDHGLTGHGFVHESVMEVPVVDFKL